MCAAAPPNMVLWLAFDETNGIISANLVPGGNNGTQFYTGRGGSAAGHPGPRSETIGWSADGGPGPAGFRLGTVEATKPVPQRRLDRVASSADGRVRAYAGPPARAAAARRQLDEAAAQGGFHPDYRSAEPLREALDLTAREAAALLRVAQGKSNGDTGVILGMSEKTVKQHLGVVFQKLGIEGRRAATLRALEVLSGPAASRAGQG